MTDKQPVRIDKYLWAVRIYKTRSQASEACRKGRITINESPVKPSRVIEGNEIITVKRPPVVYTFRVIMPIENRVSAKLASSFLEDITPESEKSKIGIQPTALSGFRPRGEGRPTKKERRTIDRWIEGLNTPGTGSINT
jgi:ribosome-associated heat shock protein Hsp15